MDRRLLTVIGLSLVFALVVTGIFYQMTSRGTGGKREEASEFTDLVIAAKPLSIGLTVKAGDIRVIKVSKEAFPKGGFAKPEDVLDRPVISNILNEEPLIEGRLAQRGSGVGLAPIIPVGMRAVTVRVNDVVGVAGFVLPGMRVDVLITGTPPGTENRITRTVLQNIPVLSAGTTIQTDAVGKPVNASNVTLLVTPEQAEILTLSGNEGRIQLVLRNSGDHNIESTEGSTLRALYGVTGGEHPSAKPAEPVAVAPRPKPRMQPDEASPPRPVAPVSVVDQIVTIRGTVSKTEAVPSQTDEKSGGAQ